MKASKTVALFYEGKLIGNITVEIEFFSDEPEKYKDCLNENNLFKFSELPFDCIEIDKEIVMAAKKFIRTYIDSILAEFKSSLLLVLIWRQKILESFKYGFSVVNMASLQDKIINLQYEVIKYSK